MSDHKQTPDLSIASVSLTQPEPWLRGGLSSVPAVSRAVLHALELTSEDMHRWGGQLTDVEANATPSD